MKVVMFADFTPLPIDREGNTLMFGGLLCRKLLERGHEVVLVTSNYNHYTKRNRNIAIGTHLISKNFKIVVVKGVKYKSNTSPLRVVHNIAFTRSLNILDCMDYKPDVLMCPIPSLEIAYSLVRKCKKQGIASYVYVLDPWPQSIIANISSTPRNVLMPLFYFYDKLAGYICRNADLITAVSSQYLKWARAFGRDDRKPSYVSCLSCDDRELIDIDINCRIGKYFTVVYIGSWGESYNLEIIVEAAKLLRNQKDIRFMIYGEGAQRKKMEKLSSKIENVHLGGWVDKIEKRRILSEASVALSIYRTNAPQSLPNKIFEYMAHGVFQLSNLKGDAETVLFKTKAGVTLKKNNAEELAKEIMKLKSSWVNGKKKEIREVYDKEFKSDKVYGDLVSIIEKQVKIIA